MICCSTLINLWFFGIKFCSLSLVFYRVLLRKGGNQDGFAQRMSLCWWTLVRFWRMALEKKIDSQRFKAKKKSHWSKEVKYKIYKDPKVIKIFSHPLIVSCWLCDIQWTDEKQLDVVRRILSLSWQRWALVRPSMGNCVRRPLLTASKVRAGSFLCEAESSSVPVVLLLTSEWDKAQGEGLMIMKAKAFFFGWPNLVCHIINMTVVSSTYLVIYHLARQDWLTFSDADEGLL